MDWMVTLHAASDGDTLLMGSLSFLALYSPSCAGAVPGQHQHGPRRGGHCSSHR